MNASGSASNIAPPEGREDMRAVKLGNVFRTPGPLDFACHDPPFITGIAMAGGKVRDGPEEN